MPKRLRTTSAASTREVIITKEDVLNALPDVVVHLLGTYDITTIRASMGMYLLCKMDTREHRYQGFAYG